MHTRYFMFVYSNICLITIYIFDWADTAIWSLKRLLDKPTKKRKYKLLGYHSWLNKVNYYTNIVVPLFLEPWLFVQSNLGKSSYFSLGRLLHIQVVSFQLYSTKSRNFGINVIYPLYNESNECILPNREVC